MKPLANFAGFVFAWLLLIVLTFGIGLVLVPVYWALVIRNLKAREEVAYNKLQATLMAHENVAEKTVQSRICALLSRRQLVAITNSRLIVITRSLFGGFTMKDYQWKDLHDARLSENVLPNFFGSSLSFQVKPEGKGMGALAIDGISSAVASKIYSEAQSQEQAWEEKRRIRDLEEKRAASGGITLGSGMVGVGGGSNGVGVSLEDLEKAKKLFDSGAVSDAEYQEIKAKILSRQT